jgi:hypothetical protein
MVGTVVLVFQEVWTSFRSLDLYCSQTENNRARVCDEMRIGGRTGHRLVCMEPELRSIPARWRHDENFFRLAAVPAFFGRDRRLLEMILSGAAGL